MLICHFEESPSLLVIEDSPFALEAIGEPIVNDNFGRNHINVGVED